MQSWTEVAARALPLHSVRMAGAANAPRTKRLLALLVTVVSVESFFTFNPYGLLSLLHAKNAPCTHAHALARCVSKPKPWAAEHIFADKSPVFTQARWNGACFAMRIVPTARPQALAIPHALPAFVGKRAINQGAFWAGWLAICKTDRHLIGCPGSSFSRCAPLRSPDRQRRQHRVGAGDRSGLMCRSRRTTVLCNTSLYLSAV